MDQENKNPAGAPSDDTTSALFVSARKKQLEQQEADRRAKEKEDQRLAAEAEVRRLELEVETRRRKAEEDAKRADEEARRIAEEARAKQAQAAANPDAILGAPPPPKKEIKLPQMPKISMPFKAERPAGAADGGAVAAAKTPRNTKLLAIIGGGAAAVILIIVLIFTLGGGARPVTASGADFSGAWYSGTSEVYDTFEFLDNGKFTLTFFDGEQVDGEYTVSGEEVEIVYNEITDILTVDGNTMLGEAVILTRELEEAAEPGGEETGYYVSGLYYGYIGEEPVEDAVYFYDDGTFEFYYADGSTDVGEWQIGTGEDTGILTLFGSGDSIAMMIADENTLYYGSEYIFYREGTAPAAAEVPADIDPEAELDAVAEISILNMGIRYPSDIYYVLNSAEDSLTLTTYASIGGTLEFTALSPVETTDGTFYFSDMAPVINTLGQSLATSYFGSFDDVQLEYETPLAADAPTGTPLQYMEKLNFTYNGEPMVGLVLVAVWGVSENGADTGEHYCFSMVNTYSAKEADDYGTLFWRIYDALFGA